jgi:hypothetical protein
MSMSKGIMQTTSMGREFTGSKVTSRDDVVWSSYVMNGDELPLEAK